MARYTPLTEALRAAAVRGQESVEYGFDELEAIIGHALPASAGVRQWWANNSQVQALAWREAGFHVDTVSLDRRWVRFARGVRGGTYYDAGRGASLRTQSRPTPPTEPKPVGAPVDVRVRLQWLDAGTITLDAAGKPTFNALPDAPGLYRLTFTGAADGRPRLYIGESDSLRRRLVGNYRNPGSGQQTSLRVNAQLREHLNAGGTVALALATSAVVNLTGTEQPLDLTRKAARLLAENAALVLAHTSDDAHIINLG